MAEHTVPQDVEADDKLLGPLSFKQFIFVLIGLGFGALAYFLSTILLPLFIIPVPFAILFFILGIPIKKDQPMEVYLAAILSFHIKPKIRLWERDGIISIIQFDNQIIENIQGAENLSFEETQERLSFLSNVVDSQGLSVQNQLKSPFQDTILSESNQITDVQDPYAQVSRNFDDIINKKEESRLQQIKQNFQPQSTPNLNEFNIPNEAPLMNNTPNKKTKEIQKDIVEDELGPKLYNLAHNDNLSIQTISTEAQKIQKNSNEEILDLRK